MGPCPNGGEPDRPKPGEIVSKSSPLRVTIHIDGGSRGNPGPAAAGVVIRTTDDQTVLHEAGTFLGQATNNVAEYSALLAGLKAAVALGAGEAEVFSDSELLVRQMNGQYRVRNAGLKGLYEEARALAGKLGRVEVHHIRREKNHHADRMVNLALDARKNVADAAQ